MWVRDHGAVIMIMTGIFQALEGPAALINDSFFVRVGNYAFDVDGRRGREVRLGSLGWG